MADVTLSELCEDAIEDAGGGLPEIDPVAAARAERDGVIILDCRGEYERIENGVIPSDVHVALENIPADAPTVIRGLPGTVDPKNAPIVCYCAAGVRSLAAVDALRKQGFTGAVSLAGGFGAWAASGGSVATLTSRESAF